MCIRDRYESNAYNLKESNLNNEILPKETGNHLSTDGTIEKMQTIDEAMQLSRSYKTPTKGMSVIDFDDTLATTKSNVLFTAPDGTEGSLTAEKFAMDGARLIEEGYKFDFKDFVNVKGGNEGPLFEKLQNQIR